MSHDIISTLMYHKILEIYRIEPLSTTALVQTRTDRKYSIVDTNIPCRMFDIDSDKLRDYRTAGEYVPGMIKMLTKYPLEPEDIVIIQDEVRKNVFYVKDVKHLSLEPLVHLFKCYSDVIIPFTGEITLTNNTKKRFTKSFFGINEELA